MTSPVLISPQAGSPTISRGLHSLDRVIRRRAAILLSASLLLLLAQAFIPIKQFIHRGDDAYYYFKVAANYPTISFWSFDRIHPTNGVQPLWAFLLTLIAQLLSWLGITDADVLARSFVALSAVLHFGSSMLLFHLLATRVSTGTAIAAAGGLLFPMGLVWARVWGMENSIYAFMLVSTVSYFHFFFVNRATGRRAVLLGVLLGLTALARLNAVIFVPCLLLYYVLKQTYSPLSERLRLAIIAGAVASVLLVSYIIGNYYTMGHVLPISSAVKAIDTHYFLEEEQIKSVFSLDFVSLLAEKFRYQIRWFITSRAMDGLWIMGARVIFDGAVQFRTLFAILSLLLFLPLLFGKPRQWLTFLRSRFAQLSPFGYVVGFGLLDAAISILLYPLELMYAMIRWWLVENEIIIIVAISTLAVASFSYMAGRFISHGLQVKAVMAVLVLLVVFQGQQMVRFYWSDSTQYRDWRLSWNDESYQAARWVSEHLPEEATIGSWNAGVLGYYAKQRVVNLDGLINSFEILPYLEQRRIDEYIRTEGLDYLSDMNSMFERVQVRESLKLTEVYSHYSSFMGEYYRIYRVDD